MAADEILLSIIVPIARMAGKLERLKEWLSEVDLEVSEVLLIHDEQDEETGLELIEIVEECSNKNLKLISGAWGNPGGPRNRGLTESSGNWITFWDCDDLPLIPNVFNAIESHPDCEILIGAFEVIDSQSEKLLKTFYPTELEEIFFNPGLWRMIFNSEVISNSQFPSLSMAEDQIFLMNIEPWKRNIKFTNKVLYKYYINQSDQLTSRKGSILDLRFAIQQTFSRYRKSSLQEKKYVSILLIRQCSTFLKKVRVTGIFYAFPVLFYLLASDTVTTLRVFQKITSKSLDAK